MQKYKVRHTKADAKSSQFLDGRFALGAVFGAGMLVFILALEIAFGQDGASDGLLFTLLPVIVSVFLGALSIAIAFSALKEQRLSRQADIDPVLIVHLGQREDARSLITLNISNVGAGAALNVCLQVDQPNDTENDKPLRRYIRRLFKEHHPIAVILQGKSIEYDFALGFSLLGQEGMADPQAGYPLTPVPPFAAKLSYEDLTGARYASEFLIDVRELAGLGASQRPITRIASALEKIAKQY